MVSAGSSETSVDLYQSTRYHIQITTVFIVTAVITLNLTYKRKTVNKTKTTYIYTEYEKTEFSTDIA
jgi:hypothetical protein